MGLAVLAPLAWLILTLGFGLILISVVPRKGQLHSPARKAAGALAGAAFCLLAGIVVFPVVPQKIFAIAAAFSIAASMYCAAHARKVDKAIG